MLYKQLFEERLKIIVEQFDKLIYPSFNEIWLYESKRRMHYWLKANNIPHPKTWVFYDRDKALDFVKEAVLPIVHKTDLGAGTSGVKIFRSRKPLIRFVKKCFKKGVVRKYSDPRDRQWGNVLLQEYLPDIIEWRILRLGNSYFGHQKLKKGQFHSGSGRVGWYDPPKRLLDFVRNLTDKGGFTSMDVDIFETSDGHWLVSELQSLFGSYLPYQMLVNNRPGRYVYGKSGWHFEEGVFNENGSCNLRVQYLLEQLGKQSKI